MPGHEPEPQTPAERRAAFAARLLSNRPNLPCCEFGTGACTGGPRCWSDEPDNIPEDFNP